MGRNRKREQLSSLFLSMLRYKTWNSSAEAANNIRFMDLQDEGQLEMIRSLEMLRHSPTMTMLFDEQGQLIQAPPPSPIRLLLFDVPTHPPRFHNADLARRTTSAPAHTTPNGRSGAAPTGARAPFLKTLRTVPPGERRRRRAGAD